MPEEELRRQRGGEKKHLIISEFGHMVPDQKLNEFTC